MGQHTTLATSHIKSIANGGSVLSSYNLKNYDEHFIINAVKKEHGPMPIVPSNIERFLSFSIGRLQFIDSFQFASESLDKLAKNMRDEDLLLTQKAFPDPDQFQLMRQKGVFPYDLISDVEMIKSKTPIEFPSIQKFFNKLTD